MSKPRVFVIFYSTYGHVHKLAQSMIKGLEKAGTVKAEMYQFPETLNDDILKLIHAPPKPDVPIITIDKLASADAFLFGFPTRFGNAPSQVKSFFDGTGELWAKGTLYGKPAGVFVSSAVQHGGQETTVSSFLPNLVHHGMPFIPLGFKNPHLSDNSEVIGGSAWGAGTVANDDGSRQPSAKELELAEYQGEEFAKVVVKLSTKEPSN